MLVVGLAGTSWGQEAPPAAKAELARQFLAIGRAALRDKKPDRAAEALGKAMGYDPAQVEAAYLLGRISQSAGSAHRAAAWYRKVVELTKAKPETTPQERRWRADAEAQLRRLSVYPKKWRALRVDFAKRFRALAAGHGGLPSCVRALEIASALVGDDEKVSAELSAARALVGDVLPPPPTKPDPEGAELLLKQAAKQRKAGRTAEAIRLLRHALALSREAPALATLAEVQLASRRPADAAVAATEARKLLPELPGKLRGELEVRLAGLLARADPHAATAEALLRRFASAARELAAKARADNDADTGDEIESLLSKLLPAPRRPARPSGGTSPPPGRPDLASEHVRCRYPGGARLRRTARSVELRCIKTSAHRGGAQALVGMTRFHCGSSVKATWRVQQLDPPPQNAGAVAVAFLPSPDVKVSMRKSKRAVEISYSGRDSFLKKADQETREDMYNKSGSYSVSFEKAGAVVTIKVGGDVLARFRLTRQRERELASRPMTLWMAADGRNGRPVGIRATLTGFSCSGDCIQQVPEPHPPPAPGR